MRPTTANRKLNLRVGQWVEVRNANEIIATLDENGCLDGLPFMPEMLEFCGKKYRVRKRATKVIDMVKMTGLRKMTSAVILDTVRCAGTSHGGCQAGCHLLWKETWLRKVSRSRPVAADSPYGSQDAVSNASKRQMCDEGNLPRFACLGRGEMADGEYYRCQATQLFDASSYLAWWDPRQYLIDLWSGNVSFGEFGRVFLMGLFNAVQQLRGGNSYPYLMPNNRTQTPTQELNLMPGEVVQVRTKQEIQETLDQRSRNRGLWFDKEMIRYCGGRFRVLRRVERTIDEKTGKLIILRNPCIILEGVTAKGDYHRFNPQNEFIFWREIWLLRV